MRRLAPDLRVGDVVSGETTRWQDNRPWFSGNARRGAAPDDLDSGPVTVSDARHRVAQERRVP